jgi:restriction endonuclease S subunit
MSMADPKLMSNAIRKIWIPIATLAFQEEIVTIFNKLEILVNDISVALNARYKQYEYSRDQLLSFREDDLKTDLRFLLFVL